MFSPVSSSHPWKPCSAPPPLIPCPPPPPALGPRDGPLGRWLGAWKLSILGQHPPLLATQRGSRGWKFHLVPAGKPSKPSELLGPQGG